MSTYKKKTSKIDMPEDFTEETLRIINRIELKENVFGVLYFRNDEMQMYSVPEVMSSVLANRLPCYNAAVRSAIKEIDPLDQLVAFRIETKSIEIVVATGTDFAACVVHAVRKENPKKHKKSLKQ